MGSCCSSEEDSVVEQVTCVSVEDPRKSTIEYGNGKDTFLNSFLECSRI